jgi:hypothetical protein
MSGALPGGKRHVVVLEIQGPKTKKQYDEFQQALENLVKQHGGTITVNARGKPGGGAKK